MSSHSKPFPYDQGERKTTEQLIQDFCRDLEKGDFGLSKLIKYGYILYGQTRSGKTATAHLLSGNALKGIKIGGDDKVQIVTSKNRNAKIGNTPVSQTRVPNIFEIKDPNNPEEKVCVIDTPGYGDTYGTFRILGNGYYHYKLYSNVQNMKFILCFDLIQLKNTAELFIDTIVHFTEYFKDYKENRHEIWKSCVFLINKVDESSDLKDIKSQISAIEKMIKLQKKQEEIDLIKQFIRYILDEDRVFTIKKYKPGESATRAELLKDIDSKISWWSRQLNPDKQEDQVDMSPVMFNITKPILVELTRNQLSKQEFIQLIKHYNFRVNQILQQYKEQDQNSCSLDFVFNQIVRDAMGQPDSHEFLTIMKKYVDKYYHIYDPQYKDQREKLQKELFGALKQNSQQNVPNPSKGTKIKDKNFLVKKFNFLQNIQKQKSVFNQMFNNPDQMSQWKKKTVNQKISQMTKGLYEMIRQFNNISFKRKNRAQIIYKYGYMIYRVISEVEVILLLIQGASEIKQGDKASKNKILEAADGNNFILNRPLTDFMGLNYTYEGKQDVSFEELRQEYIKRVNLNSDQFNKVTINWSLIDLFSSTEVQDDPQVVQKIIILLEKFSEQFLRERQTRQQNRKDTQMLIQRLTVARVNCSQLYELTQDQERKSQYFFLMRRITDNMGKLLIIIKKYELARRVYDSIMYVDSVCDLFKQQIKFVTIQQGKKSRTNQINPYSLRVQYANYLSNHGRGKQATIVLQQAFELAVNKMQLEEIRVLLNDSMLQKAKDNNNIGSYEQNLFQNKLFKPFDQDLINNLESLIAQSMPPSQIMM